MGSKWWKVKTAFGFPSCFAVPKTLEGTPSNGGGGGGGRFSDAASSSSEVVSTASRKSDSRLLSFKVSKSSSSSPNKLSKSVSRSSKKTCSICLGTMKLGQGHALFTAECSHSFHFHCIASNVKHGNQICPVCRAKWKDIPFQGPPSDLPHGRPRIRPVNSIQDDSMAFMLSRGPLLRSNSNRHSQRRASEPVVFNDDDPLEDGPEFADNSFNRGISDNHSTRSINIKTYPEFSAVQRSTTKQFFSVLVNLKADIVGEANTDVSRTSRAPVDLVTVLDISGSMMGTKLMLLKRAMGFVIQNLGPSDRLSVVTFSSSAHRLFPLRRMTERGKEHALQAVNSLYANGGTNISEGLKKGVKVIGDRTNKNPVCSIILLSDGQDSSTERSQLRPDLHPRLQFPVHAFGFGSDHDPDMLHSISEASGGTFSFIEAEGVIQDAFAQCIGGLLSVVVQNLQVKVESMHPGISLGPLKAGSYTTRFTNNAQTGFVDFGDLYADEERDFLVYLNVPMGDRSKETMLITVRCEYTDPFSKETMITEAKEVKIQRPEIVKESIVSIEVDRQKNRVQAAEAMADSRAAAERGSLSNAVSILENSRRVLLETPSLCAGDQLSVGLVAELREMQERMASRQKYEESGRAYVLSGMSSHSWQRATARGDSTEFTTTFHSYQTPSMVNMLSRSQNLTMSAEVPPSSPPTLPPRYFTDKMQPR